MVEIRTELHEEVDRLIESGLRALDNQALKDAHHLFREAYDKNPEDPKACSYYGYTVAMVEDKAAKGLELCKKAIQSQQLDPMFYLNIAQIYFKLNRKRETFGAIKKGLQVDRTHRPSLKFWKEKLGIRRRPAIPFLPRENGLNKLLGKWTYKGK